ncbi:hypothetical protein O181_026046 [Austropuccinia psidii MF-1]|uniref:Uncharacterized protein n=1 Tax=Austropuccinia psidii MF-1 TaxID=1389203 RepID=A0A9Q3CJR2_9BASI|nr:hypothetical protein [Austropuccinia psidii MF-1]
MRTSLIPFPFLIACFELCLPNLYISALEEICPQLFLPSPWNARAALPQTSGNVGNNALFNFPHANFYPWWHERSRAIDQSWATPILEEPTWTLSLQNWNGIRVPKPVGIAHQKTNRAPPTRLPSGQVIEISSSHEGRTILNNGYLISAHTALNYDHCSDAKIPGINLDEIDLSEAYELEWRKIAKYFQKELTDFLTTVQTEYFEQAKTHYPLKRQGFHKRLAMTIQKSMVQLEIYMQLTQINAKEHELIILDAFKFFQAFWMLALTHKVDPKNKYQTLNDEAIFEKFLNSAKVSFEGSGGHEKKATSLSWYGFEAFLNVVGNLQLTRPNKSSINAHLRSLGNQPNVELAEENSSNIAGTDVDTNPFQYKFANLSQTERKTLIRFYTKRVGQDALKDHKIILITFMKGVLQKYDKLPVGLRNLKTSSVLKRIFYAIKASFIHMTNYPNVRNGINSREMNSADVEVKALELLKSFWEAALFYEGEPKCDNFAPLPLSIIADALKGARKALSLLGTNEEKAEVASWFATKICLKRLWNQDLEDCQKTQIHNIIIKQGKDNHLEKRNDLAEEEALIILQVRFFPTSFPGMSFSDTGLSLQITRNSSDSKTTSLNK